MSIASFSSAMPSSEHIHLPLEVVDARSLWQRAASDWRRLLSVTGALALALAVLPATLSS
jgi:hypothetical protein